MPSASTDHKGWLVESSSDKSVTYWVDNSPIGLSCTCPGYLHWQPGRKVCWHIRNVILGLALKEALVLGFRAPGFEGRPDLGPYAIDANGHAVLPSDFVPEASGC